GVVVADPAQVFGAAAAQVGEPCGGSFAAGKVVFAYDTQNLALDRGQAAVFPDTAPAPAGGVQEVDMGAADDRVRQAREGVAGGEQRAVVGFAVVGEQDRVVGQPAGEFGEHGALGAEGGHQQLADAQAAVVPVGGADHEGAGTGAAGEAGGF